MDKLVLPKLPAGYRWKVGTKVTDTPKVMLQRKILGFWSMVDFSLIYDGLYAEPIDREIVKSANKILKEQAFHLEAKKYYGIYE